MKKTIATAILALACVSVMAQGALNFANRDLANGVDAPIFNVDGVAKLDGAAYMADLYFGAVGADPATFTSLGLAQPFRTGAAVGYWQVPATSIAVPGFAAAQNVQVQVRAWRVSDGATWQAAYDAQGVASPFDAARNAPITISLTGPPNAPAALTGLASHSLIVVPEPSTILLGLAGLGGLLFLRRRKA